MSNCCTVRVVQNPTYARVVSNIVIPSFVIFPPSPIYSLSGSTSIVVTAGYRLIRLKSTGGVVTNIATPCIEEPPTDGTFCLLMGMSDTDRIIIPDESDVPGNQMRLAFGRSFDMGLNDSLPVVWDAVQSLWIECFGRVDSY